MATGKPNRSPRKGTAKERPSTSVGQRVPRQSRGAKSLGSKESVEKEAK